ncbi:GspH/FimT family pseudopilin [Luteibacter aegosomatissinici]|uniref:GspH/FimT family pseudopilin n=1 Tax=Luteibacter aegosomatissinici TaxID=2911539 RepID=UPI001FF874A5|nr:GspH/FimT family pseudopilin [Luteibacter aegosomatissinici]UPG95730.1 GspH/FimT family pseudopilin [Luteibacter aegosomatissinici]
MHRSQRAFTLTELAATALILALAAMVAVPSLASVIAHARLRTAAEALADDLSAARRAAITRGGGVTLCPSRDGHHCSHRGRWEQGWIIQHGSVVLSAHDALAHSLAIHASESRDRIGFDAGGRSPGTNATITLCVRKRPATAISVVNSAAGRIHSGPAEAASAAACSRSRENNR